MTRQPAAIILDLRALADELEEALNAPPKPSRPRRASPGSRKKPELEVSELQRAKARRLLRERGLIE
jgi:hypothetical protein